MRIHQCSKYLSKNHCTYHFRVAVESFVPELSSALTLISHISRISFMISVSKCMAYLYKVSASSLHIDKNQIHSNIRNTMATLYWFFVYWTHFVECALNYQWYVLLHHSAENMCNSLLLQLILQRRTSKYFQHTIINLLYHKNMILSVTVAHHTLTFSCNKSWWLRWGSSLYPWHVSLHNGTNCINLSYDFFHLVKFSIRTVFYITLLLDANIKNAYSWLTVGEKAP
jgi:hypothetical protein